MRHQKVFSPNFKRGGRYHLARSVLKSWRKTSNVIRAMSPKPRKVTADDTKKPDIWLGFNTILSQFKDTMLYAKGAWVL